VVYQNENRKINFTVFLLAYSKKIIIMRENISNNYACYSHIYDAVPECGVFAEREQETHRTDIRF
jgi:hypothetical protein